MKYAYRYNALTGEYVTREECQLDPLESKAQGKNVYLLPLDCTYEVPMSPKEGFAVVFNGQQWIHVEDHRRKHDEGGTPIDGTGTPFWLKGDDHYAPPRYMTEIGALPKGALLEPPPKTEEEVKQERIAELRSLLEKSDYIGARIAEGSATVEHYADVISQREVWRTELRELLGESI